MSEDFNDKFYRPPNFCLQCGDLLDFELISSDCVKCQKCGGESSLDAIKNHYITTDDIYDYSRDWMNKLMNREDKLRTEQEVKRTIANEICPKCGYDRMYFTTRQTRSADEGSTVFYECVKCHYKHNINN